MMRRVAKSILHASGLEVSKRLPPSVLRIYLDVGHATPPGQPMAKATDVIGRFREIVMDPLNLAIRRHPDAGLICGDAVILHNGNRACIVGPNAYYGAFSSILVINRGVHEPLQEFVFQEMLDRLGTTPVMIELGAYWAHYSMWLKKICPTAITHLIEPEAEYLQAGQRNFAINGYEGEFRQAFVGRDAWSLDAYNEAENLLHIDVLLADIEGYEAEMLDGAASALAAKNVDYFFISTHSQKLHEAVVETLAKEGYRIEINSDFEHHTTMCDGLVVASSPRAAPILSDFTPLGREELATQTPEEIVKYLGRAIRQKDNRTRDSAV